MLLAVVVKNPDTPRVNRDTTLGPNLLARCFEQVSYRLENKVVALTRELTQRSEDVQRLERERKIAADKLTATKERLDAERRARETVEATLQVVMREKVDDYSRATQRPADSILMC